VLAALVVPAIAAAGDRDSGIAESGLRPGIRIVPTR